MVWRCGWGCGLSGGVWLPPSRRHARGLDGKRRARVGRRQPRPHRRSTATSRWREARPTPNCATAVHRRMDCRTAARPAHRHRNGATAATTPRSIGAAARARRGRPRRASARTRSVCRASSPTRARCPGATEGSYRGAASYFAKINSEGGICGRKIALLKGDDGLDPAKARAEFRRLEPQVARDGRASSPSPTPASST